MRNTRFKGMLSILLLAVFCTVAFFGGLAVAKNNSNDRSCRVSISNDQYVAPAAELASTKGNPDFVTLENSVVKVTSLPNRGRLIFDYYYKPAEVSLLHNETQPMPLELDDNLFLEFGGYYTSYPWNQRSNQPYDLEYRVNDDASSGCSITVFKSGEDFPLDFATELKLKPNDPAVYLEIELSNPTEKERKITWNDKLIVSAGEKLGGKAELSLPEGIYKIALNQNDSGWMGEEGKVLSWPQPWRKWENFEAQGRFSVPLEDSDGSKLKIYYPEKRIELVKEWGKEDNYEKLYVLSWGPSYEDTLGAYPGFLISSVKPELTVGPGETKTFRISLYASEGR